MRTAHHFAASTNPTTGASPMACPSLHELWASVEGERDHDELRHTIDHCSSCASCAERWKHVCEQSVCGAKMPPEVRAAASLAKAAASESQKGGAPHADTTSFKSAAYRAMGARANSGLRENTALRSQEENFARPSVIPWAVGAAVVVIAILFLALS